MRLEQRPEGGWRLHLTLTAKSYTVDSGAPLVYEGRKQRSIAPWERMPVTAITATEASAYMAWLDRSGKLPGARYCNEYEWERAARGADGRLFVSGAELHPEDANFDATYGKVQVAFGPDPVGSYPQNVSPFGLRDTDGNAYELTVPAHPNGSIMLRGGAYFYSEIQARTAVRIEYPAELRDPTVGLRVCATWRPSADKK
jgi:formylglycine-generating enzyme required for sulfatase activity